MVQTGSKAEAAFEQQSFDDLRITFTELNGFASEEGSNRQETGEEDLADRASGSSDPVAEENETMPGFAEENSSAPADHATDEAVNNSYEENEAEQQPFETAAELPSEAAAHRGEEKGQEIKDDQILTEPAAEPAVEPAPIAPVSYAWSPAENYTFRVEVKVTNSGTDTSKNVNVSVPLPENSSPYQTTSLQSVNYETVSTTGRVSTFSLGDIEPGKTSTIIVDFDMAVRPVAVNSTNDTMESAREVYEKYAGSGNCRTLARKFIDGVQEIGINAREVIGFARPQRGAMTAGSLQGSRHSWAEFYVDGLGWVPVDLTFQYFGELPHTSHLVEAYNDQSITVNYSSGTLNVSWGNFIL